MIFHYYLIFFCLTYTCSVHAVWVHLIQKNYKTNQKLTLAVGKKYSGNAFAFNVGGGMAANVGGALTKYAIENPPMKEILDNPVGKAVTGVTCMIGLGGCPESAAEIQARETARAVERIEEIVRNTANTVNDIQTELRAMDKFVRGELEIVKGKLDDLQQGVDDVYNLLNTQYTALNNSLNDIKNQAEEHFQKLMEMVGMVYTSQFEIECGRPVSALRSLQRDYQKHLNWMAVDLSGGHSNEIQHEIERWYEEIHSLRAHDLWSVTGISQELEKIRSCLVQNPPYTNKYLYGYAVSLVQKQNMPSTDKLLALIQAFEYHMESLQQGYVLYALMSMEQDGYIKMLDRLRMQRELESEPIAEFWRAVEYIRLQEGYTNYATGCLLQNTETSWGNYSTWAPLWRCKNNDQCYFIGILGEISRKWPDFYQTRFLAHYQRSFKANELISRRIQCRTRGWRAPVYYNNVTPGWRVGL